MNILHRVGLGRNLTGAEADANLDYAVGPSFSVVSAAANGAPGGTADDTAALVALMASVPAGTFVELANAVYSIQPDALTWDTEGVILGTRRQSHSFSTTTGPARIKILADGGYGIKVGAAANYPASMKVSSGLMGVAIDGNSKKFSDAALAFEGMTKAVFSDSMLFKVGQDISGRESRAFRLRAVWDSLFNNNFFHSLYNPGNPLIYFDAQQTDANGNCNNLRFNNSHVEQVSGRVFASAATSNLDRLSVESTKFEFGNSITRGSSSNFVFDLDNSQRCLIRGNSFNRFATTLFGGLYRFGNTASSFFNRAIQNDYYLCSGIEAANGAGAAFTQVYDNVHVNPVSKLTATNAAVAPWRFDPAVDPSNNDFTTGALAGFGGVFPNVGWQPATLLDCNNASQYVGDTSSLFPTASILRQTTSLNAFDYISFLPHKKLSDYPTAVTIAIRCRRPSTGAVGALQITTVGGSGTTVQSSALAANTNWQVVTVVLPSANLVTLTQMILQYGTSNAQAVDIDAIKFA